MPIYIVKSPKQLKIVPCIFSGINLPANSPNVLPIRTVNELNIVPPAGSAANISSIMNFSAPDFLRIIIRDRIDAIKISQKGKSKLNLNSIMKQAKQMQNKMMQVQEKLAEEKVEASVGGGMVTATFTGHGDLVGIKIDPEVINPDDKEMLEDLVASAVNEGIRKSRELMNERMGGITGALGSMGMGF